MSWTLAKQRRKKKNLSGDELYLLMQCLRCLVRCIGKNYGLKLYLKMNHSNASSALRVLYSRAFLFTRMWGTVHQSKHIYFIMEKEKGKEGEVMEVEDVRRRGVRRGTPSNLWWTRCCTLEQGILPQTVPVKTPSVEMGPGICQH